MLNDWEKRRLDEIERDLAADAGFVHAIAGSRPRLRHLVRVRNALCPWGFLAAALASMILAIGDSVVPALAGFGVTSILACVWMHAALSDRDRGPRRPPRRGQF